MATLETGQYLNQYVAPQLLQEMRNFNDDFMGVLPGASPVAITSDGLRMNRLNNNVGFYVDNAAGFTAKKMTGDRIFVPWEKYDTDPTEVDDAEIRALPYDKRAYVRVKHTEAMKIGLRDHTMWKLAPPDATNSNMPVLRTTGGDDGTGRKRLVFRDLVMYIEMVRTLNLPDASKYFLILCAQHQTDLMIDRDSAAYFANKDVFFDPVTAKLRSMMGFKFFENNFAPLYAADGTKKAKGALATAGDQAGSTFFYAPNAVKHIDSVKILYSPETTDTRSADPKSEFRLQTHGLIDRIVDYGFGSIVSGNV